MSDTLLDDDKEFFTEVTNKLTQWVADGAKEGEKLLIPTKNSFFTMIVHEVVRAKGETLFSESMNGGVEVSHVSKEQKQALIDGRVEEVRPEHSDGLVCHHTVTLTRLCCRFIRWRTSWTARSASPR